jgi:hypothetical protein
MGPAPYGQPEPFQPGPGAVPIAQPKRRSNRRFLPVAAAVVVGVIAFAGGYAVANATAAKATATGTNEFGGGQFFPGASGRPRGGNGGAFGGGAAGTIGSVSPDQMTITTQNGSRIVLLTPTTTVTEVTSATKAISDLTSGQTVTVIGTPNPDGSVTATRIVIGDIGVLGGRGFGPDRSPAPSTAP